MPIRGSEFANANIDDIVDKLTTDEAISLTAGVGHWHTFAIPRLHVPALKVRLRWSSIRALNYGNRYLTVRMGFEAVTSLCPLPPRLSQYDLYCFRLAILLTRTSVPRLSLLRSILGSLVKSQLGSSPRKRGSKLPRSCLDQLAISNV
jgi:hypothetical protein